MSPTGNGNGNGGEGESTATLKAVCPNCGSPREADAVFCEVCGLDFATGKLPSAPPVRPASAEPAWTLLIEVDPDFFASNQPDGGTLELPKDAPPREVPLRSDEVLIGRTSVSANLHPDVDLGSDPGVSRRHAVLKRQAGGEWVVVDQGSTNGTRVDGQAVPAGQERPIDEGSVVHVGAWTKLTLRRSAA